jgi:hypothetical protein
MDYENTKEQAICCSITYLWVLTGTYRQRCNSISILCVYRNTVVLCKRKLDLLRIESPTTALFFSPKLQPLLWKTMLFERSKRSMDEMKIGSKFTTSIISKLASLAIRKKFGYDVKLNLNEVKATVVDGKTHVHLDIDADLEKDELTKILKSIGL